MEVTHPTLHSADLCSYVRVCACVCVRACLHTRVCTHEYSKWGGQGHVSLSRSLLPPQTGRSPTEDLRLKMVRSTSQRMVGGGRGGWVLLCGAESVRPPWDLGRGWGGSGLSFHLCLSSPHSTRWWTVSVIAIRINQKDKKRWVTVPPLPSSLQFGLGGWFRDAGGDGDDEDAVPGLPIPSPGHILTMHSSLSSHLSGRCAHR